MPCGMTELRLEPADDIMQAELTFKRGDKEYSIQVEVVNYTDESDRLLTAIADWLQNEYNWSTHDGTTNQ